MKLEVVLGASQEASFGITLFDNLFVNKWKDELEWCLNNCNFNQDEAFASFCSLEQSAQRLVESCQIINTYLKDFIEIKSDILNQPQEYYNYLHKVFERLSGGYGQPTRMFEIAPKHIKDAIRKLNFYVHRIELDREQYSSLYISFDKDQYRRKSLENNDYEYFQFSFPKGTLFLHYAELGKEFIDLYEDGLTLDYSGFSNLHYFSGEATIAFEDYNAFGDIGYLQWLQSQGIDPYNKLLGHGKIPLGIVDDVETSMELIKKHQYLHSILIME